MQMEGVIKCSIVPPKKSYYPVLSYRSYKNYSFVYVGLAF